MATQSSVLSQLLPEVSRKTFMKLKYLTTVIALGLTSIAASAQVPTSTVPASATATTPSAAAPTASKDVNPFTGNPLTYEQAAMTLAVQKLQTSILDEQLKQANLRGDLGNLSIKKQAEQATAQTALVKEQVTQREVLSPKKQVAIPSAALPAIPAVPAVPAVAPAQKTTKAVKSTTPSNGGTVRTLKKQTDQASAEPTKPTVQKTDETSSGETTAVEPKKVQAAPASGVNEVQAILNAGGVFSAILNTTEGLAIYRDGSATPWGPIRVSATEVLVGGRTFQVHATTLGRFANEKLVSEEGTRGTVGSSSSVVMPTPAVIPNTGIPPLASSANGSAVTNIPANFGAIDNTTKGVFEAPKIPALPPAVN